MSETADSALGEAEYRAIESTFGETARGRLFLAEFARRSRKADVTSLMAAMERLKQGAPKQDGKLEQLKARIAELAGVIQDGTGAATSAGFEDLAAALRDAESATSDILDAAEHIQEVAWMLRERGADRGICDLLDTRSSEIYAACSLHDGAAKRISQALRAGRALEERIAALCDEWGILPPSLYNASSSPSSADALAPGPAEGELDVGPVADGVPHVISTSTDASLIAAQQPEPMSDAAATGSDPASAREPALPSESAPSVSARRRKQLEALAEIDALGIREKLNLFT